MNELGAGPAGNNGSAAEAKKLATIVYLLQALSLLIGVTLIAAIIINYLKKQEVAGTFVESHFRWQIRTFWYVLLWSVIGGVTSVFGIGVLILLAAAVWFIYRIVRGWLQLNDNKPMYV